MGSGDDAFFAEIRRYVGFGPEHEAALRALRPHVEPFFDEIVGEFYDTLSRHVNAARVLSGPEQVERLKGTLRDWLATLLAGPWDAAYLERRARIGRVHVRISLPQRYMFTAMSVIRARLSAIASAAYAGDPARRDLAQAALDRILDLELAIMLETYREEYVDRVQRLERRARVEIEDRLAQAQMRYMAIVENAAALVVATDDARRILLFNGKAEQATGFGRAEVLGTDCLATMCHPDSRERVAEKLAALIRGESVDPFESRLLTKGGHTRWVRWHLTTLGIGEESMSCAIGLDITDERALARRTRRAEQLASLGTLAAGLAHEIRNPLNAAKLQLLLVERKLGRDDADERRAAQAAAGVVRAELERLAALVTDFLSFARPNELNVADGDLRRTLESVANLLRPAAAEAGVALRFELPPAPVAARFDDERIRQVMLNLVRNAVDAAGPAGDVHVTLRPGAERVEIRVSDSGPGIPPDLNVFEPFATTKEGGTGLGLPIAHRIVVDHGGQIDVAREAGRTIFAVELPIAGP